LYQVDINDIIRRKILIIEKQYIGQFHINVWIKILDNQVIGSYFFPENINISRGLFRFSGGNTTHCEKTDDFTIKSIIEKLIEKNE